MAEKRGNYEYRDDGTSAQLVTAETTLEGSDATIPVDIQARYTETVQTHNAVLNPASANSAFIDCSKFSEITFHSSVSGTLTAQWAFDGVNWVSSETATTVSLLKLKCVAPYVRFQLTATGTVSGYAYMLA